MCFLLLPLAQKKLRLDLKANRDLHGAFEKIVDTTLNVRTWFSGAYQNRKGEFIKENFTFHSACIRIANEIEYRLFGRTHEAGLVIGKTDYLFESYYISAYYGSDFSGKSSLKAKFKKLKILQDKFLKDSIVLEVVFCPSKASYYPQYLPKKEKHLSNYDYAVRLCDSLKIDYIDFDKWFRTKQSKYKLYSKTGIHWNNYGALLAMDSLTKHIEQRVRIKMPHILVNSITMLPAHDIDDDIGQGMNLLMPIKPDTLPYATVMYTKGEKPSVLFISDSYFWNFYSQGFIDSTFSTWRFKYYNKTLYPKDTKEPGKYKVIVLMATGSNMGDFGFGYIEQQFQ